MKNLILYSIVLIISGLTAGCEKDNYDPPKAFVSGRIIYQAEPLQLRNAENQLELWQDGYERKTKIPVYIDQEGSFSANVFEGAYKLVLLRGVGPWVSNSDTIAVTVTGSNTVVDVNVTPYFTIKNTDIKKSGNQVVATCAIEKVVATAAIERMVLCLGATQIVDITNQVARAEKAAAGLDPVPGTQTISINIPESLAGKGYFYARVGIKIAGVEQLIYSPVQKL